MNRREALQNTLEVVEPYLREEVLTDAQAAKIGRTFFSNLKQAQRDMARQAFEETIDVARPLLRKETLTDAEAATLGQTLHTNLQQADPDPVPEGV